MNESLNAAESLAEYTRVHDPHIDVEVHQDDGEATVVYDLETVSMPQVFVRNVLSDIHEETVSRGLEYQVNGSVHRLEITFR